MPIAASTAAAAVAVVAAAILMRLLHDVGAVSFWLDVDRRLLVHDCTHRCPMQSSVRHGAITNSTVYVDVGGQHCSNGNWPYMSGQ
jgi:hypothetical protein